MTSAHLKPRTRTTTPQHQYKLLATPAIPFHSGDVQRVPPPAHNRSHTDSDLALAFQHALTHVKNAIAHREQIDPHFASPSIFLCYAWGIRSYEHFVRDTLKGDLNAAGLNEVILDDDANQRGSIDRFTAEIEKADIVIVTGTKRLNEKHGAGHIQDGDFTMIPLQAQRILWWRYIRDLGIINHDGCIVPNLDLANRDDIFWNQVSFPIHLIQQKDDLIADIIQRVSTIEHTHLPIVQKELHAIASRMQKPGYSEKTLWIIKDGNDQNALPRQLSGQYPKISFNIGQFRLKCLAAIMPERASYDTVLKRLKNHDYITTEGTAASIENGIAIITAKTQALIENEVTGNEQPFEINDLQGIPEKEAIEKLIKQSVATHYPHHLFRLLRKMNVIDPKRLTCIYNDYTKKETAYYAAIQVPWSRHTIPKTMPHHPQRNEQAASHLIVNTDIILPVDRIIREKDNNNLVTTLKDANTRVVEIAAMGGSGKSCFTRQFLSSHQTTYGLRYDQQIWFSFYTLKSRDIMAPFEALLNLIITQRELNPKGSTTMDRRLCVQDFLNTHHTLLVLDGLEIAQKGDITQDTFAKDIAPCDVGRFKDPEFKAFMKRLMHNSKSHILVSSRLPLRDLRDESNHACSGLCVFHLSPWTDDELKRYMLSGKDISGPVDHVMPVVAALGKHPLTLSLFKGMLRQDYGGNWVNAKTVLTEINDMIKEEKGDTDYERQLRRIRGIVGGIDQRLNEDQRHLLRILSGTYGELTYTHFQALAKEKKYQNDVDVSRLTRCLLRYNIIIEGSRRGIRNVAVHPMVKLGVMSRLNWDDQMAIHETLMTHFQAQTTSGVASDDHFDELMEWAHQVVTLMRMDGTLTECSEDPRIERLRHCAMYTQMSELMGRYISQRGLSYLQQATLLREIVVPSHNESKKGMPRTFSLQGPTSNAGNRRQTGSGRPGLKKWLKTFFSLGRRGGYRMMNPPTHASPVPVNDRSYYETTLSSLIEAIHATIRDIRAFGANMDQIDRIVKLIAEASNQGIQLREPREIVPTVFYGMYVRTITKGGEANIEPGGTAVSEVRQIMGRNFTGVAEWRHLFGVDAITKSEVPALPDHMATILTSSCPLHPDTKQRIYDTHILFLMPKQLKSQDFTMITWYKILTDKQYQIKLRNGKYYMDWFKNETFANKAVNQTRWVLMPKEMLPGSRKKTYSQQQAYLAEYQAKQKRANAYQVLSAIEMTTGIFLNYLQTGDQLYGENYKINIRGNILWPYARTSDTTSKSSSVHIGHFGLRGFRFYDPVELAIESHNGPDGHIGLSVGVLSESGGFLALS